ncbi:MAG: shikimate kinase [Burkholderiales bacterium]|jgi:shikimate kinase|nr:shikimate kinase [Burkholderiales bacterium]
MQENIIIVGITGVGKTTIGKLMAEALNKEFIDLDKSIELRCGVDIPTIFEIEGEEGFRERETFELKETITKQYNFVLSVGGGCVIKKANRELLRSPRNIIIQFHADIPTLVERLSRSVNKRPLIKDTDVATKVTALYEARKEFYADVSHLVFDTSGMRPTQVVDDVIYQLKNLNNAKNV